MTEADKPVSDIAFTPSVKAVQERLGSRRMQARMERSGGWKNAFNDDLAAFIQSRTSFYFGTASADGQPYIQHRGGPAGFLRVLDSQKLGFADFAGNRQYISYGNLTENPKVVLFLMDYENRQRVKIWGTATVIENDQSLIASLTVPEGKGRPERAILIDVNAWDANCPQHIPQLYPEEVVHGVIAVYEEKLAALRAELGILKGEPS